MKSFNCPKFAEEYQHCSGEKILIDVRRYDEIAASGLLPHAVHIPLDQLEVRVSELSKSKEIFIYCKAGGRAEVACEILEDHGFSKLSFATSGGYEALKELF